MNPPSTDPATDPASDPQTSPQVSPSIGPSNGPSQVAAVLVGNSAAGAYRHLVLDAPRIAATARPGQFVAAAVGGESSGALLRRSFSIHAVRPDDGLVEIVVSPNGVGTRWLCDLRPGGVIDLLGPLGRPFPLPADPVACVLVGGGYGSAPMFWLGQVLRGRGCRVDLVLGAAGADRLFGTDLADAAADSVHITTDDGSLGTKGRVSAVIPGIARERGSAVIYGCGPMGMLHALTSIAGDESIVAQVAVEAAMACGIGICMTCVMPVIGRDGQTRMTRSCTDGPVFRGDRVRWEAFVDGRTLVPDDALGAPRSPATGPIGGSAGGSLGGPAGPASAGAGEH